MLHTTKGTAALAVVTGLALSSVAFAADHAEAPTASADAAADIADLFAWHDEGTLTTILTVAGLGLPGEDAVYDPDVAYGIHIDNDGDDVADIDIVVKFGQDGQGNWGVGVWDLPGTGATVKGSVEQVLPAAGGKVWVGLRDDPFFFDLDGYTDTLSTGTLSFDAGRDSLAGTNVTAIALEMDLGAALEGSESLQVWATSGRL